MKWIIRILPLLYMGLIWFLSSMPADAVVALPDSKVDSFLKESMHLIEFAILYILLVLAFLTGGRFTKKLNIILAVIAALYGVTDEIHQSFIPARSSSLIDVAKDWIGVAVACYFVYQARFSGRFKLLASFLKRIENIKK
ncbi:VanZ family protein [Bacillus infantis]|uniref:VanZ family protein n=1 Tax=Bacillus infantis TaxID=324767 RepID=UPI003CF56913